MQSILYKDDIAFPNAVNDLIDVPDCLYFLGSVSNEIFSNCIAIVGSRKAGSYGLKVVELLVKSLSRFNVTIVSGFMNGIDTYAHTFALKYGCSTIAVMPCGPDVIVPAKNHVLYQEVLSNNGLFVSEYSWGQKPRKWFFIKRNRIIAALAKAVVIVEAGLNSGSLHTANYALSLKRQVFVVPGSIFSDESKGTNSFLSENWGLDNINIFTSTENIKSFFDFDLGLFSTTTSSSGFSDDYGLDAFESRVLAHLSGTKLTLDDLVSSLACDSTMLTQKLFELEMGGLIEFKGGYYHAC